MCVQTTPSNHKATSTVTGKLDYNFSFLGHSQSQKRNFSPGLHRLNPLGTSKRPPDPQVNFSRLRPIISNLFIFFRPVWSHPLGTLFKELSLESLSGRRWFRKLTFSYNIVKGNSSQYLSNYLKGNNNSVYNTRSASQISLNTFKTRTEKFKNSFILFCISEWNKLSNLTKQSENIKNLNIH